VNYLVGLGDEYSEEMACLARANATTQVKEIEAMISKLNTSWRPTGYYEPQDVERLIAALRSEAEVASQAVMDAPGSTSDATSSKREAINEMVTRFKDPSYAYAKMAQTARAKGTVVNAPTLKQWVTGSMHSIANAYVTATVLHCRQTWVMKWLERAHSGLMALGNLAASIGGVVVSVAEGAYAAGKGLFNMAAFLAKALPLAAIGLAGYVGYRWLRYAGQQGYGKMQTRAEKLLPPSE